MSTLPEHDGTIVYLENGLFLSSADPARNSAVIEHIGITHVLNCTGYIKGSTEELRFPPVRKDDGVLFADILKGGYKQIIIADENDIGYEDFVDAIIHPSKEFIDSALLETGEKEEETREEKERLQSHRLVVHCEAGISRSSSVVIAHLMRCRKMTLKEAYDYVHERKNNIDPNNTFLKHLLTYERHLREEPNILHGGEEQEPSLNLRRHFAIKINDTFFGGGKDLKEIEKALEAQGDDPGRATSFLYGA